MTPHEIETKYDLALEYQHYCQNCGGKLRELTDDELDKAWSARNAVLAWKRLMKFTGIESSGMGVRTKTWT